MEIGMVGLGRMGGNMAHRLLIAGHRVLTYDREQAAVAASQDLGAVGLTSLEDLVAALSVPRAVWVMVPAGQPTEDTIDALAPLLQLGDVVLDGGNSFYKDSIRRGEKLGSRGIDFIDVGTSGGIWGLTEGYALMVGGNPEAVKRLEPVFHSLAPAKDKGYAHAGPLVRGTS